MEIEYFCQEMDLKQFCFKEGQPTGNSGGYKRD